MVNGPGNLPERVPAPRVTPPPRPALKKPEFKPAEKPDFEQAPDRVTLSPKAKEVSSLARSAKAEPEVRVDRVEEARAKVSKSGNSSSSNAKIAEKLLTEQ